MVDGFIFKYLNLPNDIMIIYAFNYLRLCWNLYDMITHVKNGDYVGDYIDRLIPHISQCGSVAIKCCQWVLPKIEMIYMSEDQIFDKIDKPRWHQKLEQFLEDCPCHSLSETQRIYKQEFGSEITDEYDIKDILGSGSIGQVYLVVHKSSGEERVLKVQHPNVAYEIRVFERLCWLCNSLPYIKDLFLQVPFRYSDFVASFREQIDFIREANNLLEMSETYKDNDHLMIPKIYKISKRAIIMQYIPGETFDNTTLSEYDKGKIFLHLFLFFRNNLICENFNHGDLHQGNWKVHSRSHIAIYDFGFCWSLPEDKKHIIQTTIDIHEEGIQDHEEFMKALSDLMYDLIDHREIENKEQLKRDLIDYVTQTNLVHLKDVTISPLTTSKILNKFCLDYPKPLYLYSNLVQFLILFIQIHHMCIRYDHSNPSGVYSPNDQIFKGHYIELLTFCETYNIYPKFRDYAVKRLDDKQIARKSIFDTIDFPESIRELALT